MNCTRNELYLYKKWIILVQIMNFTWTINELYFLLVQVMNFTYISRESNWQYTFWYEAITRQEITSTSNLLIYSS